ncbi:DUF6440 family protein [Paenibacillus sp. 1182]
MTDKETNAQYLVISTARRNSDGGIALTPIIDENGKPYINKQKD